MDTQILKRLRNKTSQLSSEANTQKVYLDDFLSSMSPLNVVKFSAITVNQISNMTSDKNDRTTQLVGTLAIIGYQHIFCKYFENLIREEEKEKEK